MEKHPELGYGIMRMPLKNGEIDWERSKQLIDEYMKGEFCYFDTHPSYMMGQSQRIIREYVVKRYDRSRFLLANKMPYWIERDGWDYDHLFREELASCGVEYFDYYLLHAVSKEVYDMHERLGGFRFLREMKDKGKVRKIGFSFHDNKELLDQILENHPEMDFVQLQINYLDWENPLIQSKACYETARKYGKPILVMEPIKGGKLALGEDSEERARKALQFVKELPGIQVILSGMSKISHIIENRRTLSNAEENRKVDISVYENLKKEIERENAIPCTECGYCAEECQKGVRIPEIFSLVNAYDRPGRYDRTVYGRIKMFYRNTLLGKGGAGECVNCGMCERRCPQKIAIRGHLRRAVSLFEQEYFYTSEKNVQILIGLLRAYGIRKVIASPGALNVPFVYSVQQDGFFEMYSAPDERSAAYMACGLAEESGEPVVISCTGATASRNYLPGLTEAFYRHIPVIAVTSARPSMWIGHNVPQVIDRTKQPNDIVKMSVELPAVKDDESEWACVINGNRVLNELWHRGTGPVHINLVTTGSRDFSVRTLPYTRVIRRIQMKENYPELPDGKLGIFCGAHKVWDPDLTSAVDQFCEKYGAVVICDHTSNYTGSFRCADSFKGRTARKQSFGDIDLLIHIGDISGAYFPIRAAAVWRVHPNGEYCDTFQSLSYVFEMDEQMFFERYVKSGGEKDKRVRMHRWKTMEENSPAVHKEMPFSNAWIASQTAHRIPGDSVLHLGILNSLRIWNFYRIPESVRVYSNTGGFGIDGCLSSLVGASLVNPEKLYFGILGDLAFFYDMNVLGNRHIGDNIRLLVVNNGGGAEFKNYNHAACVFGNHADPFIAAKGHYGNRSRRLLKDYAEALGFCYRSASTKEEYQRVLPEFVDAGKRGRSLIVEIFTESEAESEALCILNGEKPGDANKKNPIETADKNVPEMFRELPAQEVILWGCGYMFRRNLSRVEQYAKIRYVCDNDREKWNKEIVPGIVCVSPDELRKKKDIFLVIMIKDAKAGFEIARQLRAMGICHYDILENWLIYASQMKWKTVK